MDAPASREIRDLVVALEKVHERGRREAQRGRAPPHFLPGEILSLIEKAVLRRRHELLRRSMVAAAIGFGLAGHRDESGVMKVVVPERVDAKAAVRGTTHEARLLALVLGDDDDAAVAGRLPRRRDDV